MRRAAALLALGALSCVAAPAARLVIGAAAPAFSLPSVRDGRTVTLKELGAGRKGVLVLFIATRCPVSNAYDERMAAVGRDYAPRGIAVVGINSNVTEPAAEVKAHAEEHRFPFPVLKDDGSRVADLYGATKTPEAYLIDAAGKLVYHGRIDENRDEPDRVKSPDLRRALDALLAGRPVPASETKAFGCSIKRP